MKEKELEAKEVNPELEEAETSVEEGSEEGAFEHLYDDETQESVKILRQEAKDATRYEEESEVVDVVKTIIGLIFTMILAFGWMLLMLLILSFIALGYLHFELKIMIVISVVFAVGAGVFYIRGRIHGARIRRVHRNRKK